MSSKKIYVHFGDDFTSKVVVEEASPFSDVLVKFLTAYEDHQQANGGPLLNFYNTFLLTTKGKKLQMKSKAFNAVEDGEDLHVEEDLEASTREKQCTNSGCGATYTDVTNRGDVCYFHPGRPVFHEGLKGWQCCTKRVVDFDEAMSLPGCTLGAHQSAMPAIKVQAMTNRPVDPKYLPKSIGANGVETFSLGGAMPAPAGRNNAVVAPTPPPAIIEEPDDPMDAVIAAGTKCRHHACNEIFVDDSSRTEACVYHPGLAVFHEGSKYWTCCKPRCAEFEEFLKIQGCKVGRHKFCPKAGEENTDPNAIKCRYDFYQQGEWIIASVYGKNMDREKTTFKFQTKVLEIKVHFKDGKHFIKDLPLYDEVDPSKCSFEILSTKSEIKLFKATPVVWESLEPTAPAQ